MNKFIRFIKYCGFYLLAIARYLDRKHSNVDYEVNTIINKYKYIVSKGPFSGMHYDGIESCGSTLYPKIMGTYESELHEVLEKILATPYELVVDIGCAEGYYAVGFAKFKHIDVIAIDIDSAALINCQKLAKLNQVEDKIKFANSFDGNVVIGKRTLVIMDCEGAEYEILQKNPDIKINNVDFLIEVHDDINPQISKFLDQYFVDRQIQKIFTISDYEKGMNLSCNSELLVKLRLVSENRRSGMAWFYVT